MRKIFIDGQPFVPTREAETTLGISKRTLLNWSQDDRRINIVITLPNGLRYIRRPRLENDPRPPVFWCIEGVAVPKPLRGFAALSEAERRALQRQGGKTAHLRGKAHRFSPEEARQAGRKGGQIVSADSEHMRFIALIRHNRRKQHK